MGAISTKLDLKSHILNSAMLKRLALGSETAIAIMLFTHDGGLTYPLAKLPIIINYINYIINSMLGFVSLHN